MIRAIRPTLSDTVAVRRKIVYTAIRRHRFTERFIYGDTAMLNYDSFFKDPEVDGAALVAFLRQLAEYRGWDDEQLGMHVHYATITHINHGKHSAIKYLESLR